MNSLSGRHRHTRTGLESVTHLRERHVTMIALGGVIGAGLFVGTGAGIALAGPAVLISFGLAGILALLVPAHPMLYGEFDRAVGHFRRYKKRELREVLQRAGFGLRELRFFSMAATLPWLFNGRLLKRA